MGVTSILCHTWGVGGIPCVHYNLIIVILRGATWVEFEIEMLGTRERDRFFEFVVISDGMDGLNQPACGPRGRDLDTSTARVEGTTSLQDKDEL